MAKALVLAALAAVFLAIPMVSAFSAPGFATGSSGSIFTLTPYSSTIFSLIFAAAILVIAYQALQRTTLGGGAAAISMALGAITFVILYTNAQILHLLLGVASISIIFIILLAAIMVPSRYMRGRALTKLLGILILLVMMYLLFENPQYSSFTNSINNSIGFNVGGIITLATVFVVLGMLVLSFARLYRRSRAPFVRIVIPLVVIFLLMIFFVPGFGSFFLTPYGIAAVVLAIVGIFFLARRATKVAPTKEEKQQFKQQKKQQKQDLKNQMRQASGKQNAINEYGKQVTEELGEDDRLAQAQLQQARKQSKLDAKQKVTNSKIKKLLERRNTFIDPSLNLSSSTRGKQLNKINKRLKKLSGGKFGGPNEERGFSMVGYTPPKPPEKRGFFGKKALPPPQERKALPYNEQKALPYKGDQITPSSGEDLKRIDGASSALDKRIAVNPHVFIKDSPIEEKNGIFFLNSRKQAQKEFEALNAAKRNILTQLQSSSLPQEERKELQNELNRINYRLNKYGRDLHR